MRKLRSDRFAEWGHYETALLGKVRTDENGCWVWQGARASNGLYGVMRFFGRNYPAHRAAWEIAHRRPMEAGKYACHTCDNKLCVNPDHIVEGSPSDNVRDAWKTRKREWPHRSVCPKAPAPRERVWPIPGDCRFKLTEDQVREMKRLRAEEGLSYQKIADQFGVSETTARFAVQGKRWGHLEDN